MPGPAFDSVGPAGGGGASQGTGGTAALTWTHTTIGGPCTILVAAALDNLAIASPSSCTCDGVTMTAGTPVESGAANTGYLQVFSIARIAAGAHTISVTPGAFANDITAGSIAFTGAVSLGTPAVSSSTKTAIVATNTSGNIIAGFMGAGNTITQAGSPATGAFLDNLEGSSGAAVGNIAGAYAPATGSSVTITWVTSSTLYCTYGVEVQGPAGTNTSPAYATAENTTAVAGTGTWVNPANAENAPDGSYATWTAP